MPRLILPMAIPLILIQSLWKRSTMSCVAFILISYIFFITALAWWIIVLAVLGVLLILGILIGIIVYRRKKARERKKRETRFRALKVP